jgi:hypothetical protein
MENTMTIAYEGVKYFTGWINPVDVNGFSLLHYDNEKSPISDSTTNIYTDGGLLGAIDGSAKDLSASRRDNGPNGVGILGTVLAAERAIRNLKKVNLSAVANKTLAQIGVNVLGGVINGALNNIFVPTAGGSNYGMGTTSAVNLPGLTGSYGTSGYFGLGSTQTGQPVAGQSAAIMIDPTTGEVIPNSSFSVPTQGNGGYVKSDPSVNLASVITNTDSEGNTTRVYYYKNGDQVTFVSDANTGETVTNEYLTGNSIPPVTSNPNSQVRTVTDPNTGITRVVGNSTTAQITNSVTGISGMIAGGYAGYYAGAGVSNLLGNGIVGKVVGGAVGIGVGNAVGVAVNNGLQALRDPVTNTITQAFDATTGTIKNVAGQLFGSGAPSDTNPELNLVERLVNSDGSTVSNYWDGSIVYRDASGGILSTVAGDSGASSMIGWGSGIPGYNQDIAGTSDSLFSKVDSAGIPSVDAGYNALLNNDLGGPSDSQMFVNIGAFNSDIGTG